MPALEDVDAPPRRDTEAERRKKVAAAVAAMLAIEWLARSSMKATMSLTIARFLAMGADAATVRQAIRASERGAILRARTAAREGAREAWRSQTGLAAHAEAMKIAADHEAADRAASSLAARWQRKQADAIAQALAEGGPYRGRGYASLKAAEAVAPHVDTIAATETAAAWNAEHEALAHHARSLGYVIEYTWEAEGDRRTCPACASLDGTKTTDPSGFDDGWPPKHPRCRCQVSARVERLH